MQKYIVKIKSIDQVTHDVRSFVTEKPENYTFTPGQATKISVNKEGWKNQKRPFTFTSLPAEEDLEFTIKIYPSHHAVTNEIAELKEGDEFIIHDAFGAIQYKGEGIFIAGGAGITPFISIFKDLQAKNEIGSNKLIFANKTKADIILEASFTKLLGDNFINILSDETLPDYAHGQITQEFIEEVCHGMDKIFYLCGPPPMVDAVEKQLNLLRVYEKSIIKETF